MTQVPEKPYEIDPRINKKFVEWRGENGEQKEAVEFILRSNKQYTLLTMPTGSGKSLIAVSAGILHPGKVIIITRNTNLAKQYENDFEIPVIIGRRHYKCIMYPELTATDCPYTGHYSQCPAIKDVLDYYEVKSLDELDAEEVEEITCPYVAAREKAKRSDVAVLNYHYFWFAYLREGLWEKPSMVIVDEAHEFPNFLVDVSTLKFNYNKLYDIDHLVHDTKVQQYFLPTTPEKGSKKLWMETRKHFRYMAKKKVYHFIKEIKEFEEYDVIPPAEFLDKTEKLKTYLEHAVKFSHTLIDYMLTIEPDNKNLKDLKIDPARAHAICEELPPELAYPCTLIKTVYPVASKALDFINTVEREKDNIINDDLDINGELIMYPQEEKIVLKYIYPHTVFEKLEKRLGNPKWVFMSATLFPRYISKELAISGRYAWFETKSEIPKEFRTLFYVPYAPMYRDYMDQKPFVREYIKSVIDEVLKEYSDERGIILVASKKDINALQSYSRYSDRFIEYSGGAQKKEQALKDHQAMKNSVLLSVAWEGIDLTDELSRFQIIFQVPFMYVGDPVVRIRRRADREWYYLSALNKIIQGAGRSIRHKNDFAVTFLFDSRFDNMIKRYSEFIPEWFKESIKKYGSIEEKNKFRSNLEKALHESREHYRKWQRYTSI